MELDPDAERRASGAAAEAGPSSGLRRSSEKTWAPRAHGPRPASPAAPHTRPELEPSGAYGLAGSSRIHLAIASHHIALARPPCVQVGGPNLAVIDNPHSGPQFGADGLSVPLKPRGSERSAKSKLGAQRVAARGEQRSARQPPGMRGWGCHACAAVRLRQLCSRRRRRRSAARLWSLRTAPLRA